MLSRLDYLTERKKNHGFLQIIQLNLPRYDFLGTKDTTEVRGKAGQDQTGFGFLGWRQQEDAWL